MCNKVQLSWLINEGNILLHQYTMNGNIFMSKVQLQLQLLCFRRMCMFDTSHLKFKTTNQNVQIGNRCVPSHWQAQTII